MNKMGVGVSVCMITYRHEPYLKEAIEGVLNQVVDFDVEFIIADDCSPDNTREVVKSLEGHKNYNWIKYTRHEFNKGMVNNFRWALNQCSGEYVALCEGDDYWTDSLKLQKQKVFMDCNPGFVICGHDASVVNQEGQLIYDSKLHNSNKRDATGIDLMNGFWVLTMSMFFRNKALKEILSDERARAVLSSDLTLTILLGAYGDFKYMTDINKAIYRVHDSGVWSQLSIQSRLKISVTNFIKVIKYFSHIKDAERVVHYERKIFKILREMVLQGNVRMIDLLNWNFLLIRAYPFISCKSIWKTQKSFLKSYYFFITRMQRG